MSRIRGKLSTIARIHYIKLVVRSLLFLAALAVYVVNRLENSPSMFGGYEDSQLLLLVLTAFFSVEKMCIRDSHSGRRRTVLWLCQSQLRLQQSDHAHLLRAG